MISLQIFSISLNKLQSAPFLVLFQKVVAVIKQAEQNDGDNDGKYQLRKDDIFEIRTEVQSVSYEKPENVNIQMIEQFAEKCREDGDQRHIGSQALIGKPGQEPENEIDQRRKADVLSQDHIHDQAAEKSRQHAINASAQQAGRKRVDEY